MRKSLGSGVVFPRAGAVTRLEIGVEWFSRTLDQFAWHLTLRLLRSDLRQR